MVPMARTPTAELPFQGRRLGEEQVEALRRLTGRWLMLVDHGHAYWTNERGYRVPPYRSVRRSLVDSLLRRGFLRPVAVSSWQRHYTISTVGRSALLVHHVLHSAQDPEGGTGLESGALH
jgi:hypothetical protein